MKTQTTAPEVRGMESLVPEVVEPLTSIERKNLAELEDIIEKHLSAFQETGFCLMQIRDNRLYRESHSSFEAYCKEKWGFARNYANKLIAASRASDDLGTIVPTPTKESHVRPLLSLPADKRGEVYEKAIASAPNGQVTAKHIRKEAKEQFNQNENEKDVEPDNE